jgi:aminocarboxymuconate-semialdehyde decarboxylase
MKNTGSIDVHAHWAPELVEDALAEIKGKKRTHRRTPLMFDLDQRVRWMNERRVDMHVLTMPGGLMPWEWLPPEAAVRIARMVNDLAIEAHIAYPDRFIAAASLPIRDPAASLAELNRVAGKPGICGIHLPNSMGREDYLFDARYDPLLARCQELRYPLLFHPLDGAENRYGGPDRLAGPSFISNTLGFPFETATTAAKLIVNGTLDRFPALDIVLPHSGGCFPYIAGRVEHGLTGAASTVKPPRPFREYVRRFHYDTLTYYPETLRFLVALVGADRMVIGTDNYAVMDVQQPNELTEELKLSAPDTSLILRGNAERLFHL